MVPARTPFPQHLKELRSCMPELLEILESGRQDDWYAFVWLEEKVSRGHICARNESNWEKFDRGLVLRVMVGAQNLERSTNCLERGHLLQLAQDFRQELERSFPEHNGRAYKSTPWGKEDLNSLKDQLPELLSAKTEVHFSPPVGNNPFNSSIETLKEIATITRQELLLRSKKHVESNPAFQELADVQTYYSQDVLTHVFVDREKNMSQVLPLTLLYSIGISKTGRMAWSVTGGMGGTEIAFHTEEQKDEVALRSLKLENAKKLTPGRYQIITGPDVSGVIAHEAFGHTQEGDTWMKGRSIAKGLHDSKTRVGNQHASIVNHPNLFSMEHLSYGTNGSHYFDHEGHLGGAQVILDQGLLLPPMTDLTSALRLSMPRTGNGKRESWRRPLMARQTNTYFTPGDKTLEELIRMVKDGFLARVANAGMEDPKGGSLTAGTSYLEEIKDGKLTGEIYLGPSGGHVELSDPVFTLLERILAKSKSVHPDNVPENKFGGCGKYHKESVNAGCGGPYILWESINCG